MWPRLPSLSRQGRAGTSYSSEVGLIYFLMIDRRFRRGWGYVDVSPPSACEPLNRPLAGVLRPSCGRGDGENRWGWRSGQKRKFSPSRTPGAADCTRTHKGLLPVLEWVLNSVPPPVFALYRSLCCYPAAIHTRAAVLQRLTTVHPPVLHTSDAALSTPFPATEPGNDLPSRHAECTMPRGGQRPSKERLVVSCGTGRFGVLSLRSTRSICGSAAPRAGVVFC